MFQRGFVLTIAASRSSRRSTCTARAVLCAAGRQWQPRSQQRSLHDRGRSRFVGLKAHIQGVSLDRHVELHTIRHGYCGMVEVADGVTNLCCWVEAEVLRRAGGTPQPFPGLLHCGKIRICVYDCRPSNRLASRGRLPVSPMGGLLPRSCQTSGTSVTVPRCSRRSPVMAWVWGCARPNLRPQ